MLEVVEKMFLVNIILVVKEPAQWKTLLRIKLI